MALRFSIIIPTRNRPALLDSCLKALGELSYAPHNFEVLISDDGSSVPPTDVIARHAASLPLRTFRTEGTGPATARNLALRAAVGEYVVFTDDDCRPCSTWLSAYDAVAQKYPLAGLGGSIVDAAENNIFGRTSQMLVTYLYEYTESARDIRFFCSNNFAFPREALLAIGGFDESFPLAAAEDRYLCSAWLKWNDLKFVPDAEVEHRQVLGLFGYLRQQFRYGRGACQYWRRRQFEDGATNRVQPLSFYTNMLRFPFGKAAFSQAITMSILLGVSQIAGILGYITERRSSEAANSASEAFRDD